jgi:RecB family exonuclease
MRIKALLRESKGVITQIKRRNYAKKRRSNTNKGKVTRILVLQRELKGIITRIKKHNNLL